MATQIEDLPPALEGGGGGLNGELQRRLEGKRSAVFLDYDGTLTPIVDRPEDAVISERMREAVSGLAERCPVCVVSGRDRRVVQELMGLDNLVVAGSHGFDVWSPEEGSVGREEGAQFAGVLAEAKARLQEDLGAVAGVSVEPKSVSVAVHYRLAGEKERARAKEVVEGLLREHPNELKVTPGKKVYEIQPKVDWDKGKAVLYLLEALGLDHDDVVPIYLGDDVTDEDAFEALSERGIGVFVGAAEDPETAGRSTSADYALEDVAEVERFLDALAR